MVKQVLVIADPSGSEQIAYAKALNTIANLFNTSHSAISLIVYENGGG